jgi:hypothetical protein
MNRQTNTRRLKVLAAAALAGVAALAAGSAAWARTGKADAAAANRTPCFFITQWSGWKSPSPNILYLGVNLHDVYQVDLSAGSSQLQWPDVHLISTVRGSDSICSPLDLQLEVADHSGFREPLIAAKLTKLTPEEVAAIPKKYRPN